MEIHSKIPIQTAYRPVALQESTKLMGLIVQELGLEGLSYLQNFGKKLIVEWEDYKIQVRHFPQAQNQNL